MGHVDGAEKILPHVACWIHFLQTLPMWGNVAIIFSGEPSKGKSVAPSKTSPTSLQYRARQFSAALGSTFTSSGYVGQGPGGQRTQGGVSQPCSLLHIGSRQTCTAEGISKQDNIRLAIPLNKEVDRRWAVYCAEMVLLPQSFWDHIPAQYKHGQVRP